MVDMHTKMADKSLFFYPGSKRVMYWYILKYIIPNKNNFIYYHSNKYSNFYDLFTGSAFLSINSNCKNIYANDINPSLIDLFQTLQTNPIDLLKFVKILCDEYLECNDRDKAKQYYRNIKQEFNARLTSKDRIPYYLFLLLNSFKGFIDFRADGQVSGQPSFHWSNRENPRFRDKQQHIEFIDTKIERIENIVINQPDFENINFTCKEFNDIEIKQDSLVFLDPPYHETILSYFNKDKDEEFQMQVFNKAKEIHDSGSHFIATNYSTSFIMDLYQKFNPVIINSYNKNNNFNKEEMFCSNIPELHHHIF